MFYASGRNNVDYIEINFNVRWVLNLDEEKTGFIVLFNLWDRLSWKRYDHSWYPSPNWPSFGFCIGQQEKIENDYIKAFRSEPADWHFWSQKP